MEHLYAPWRTAYITEREEGCPFCHIAATPEKDEAHHVLYRTETCFVVMNKFPYTPGHFMVIPHLHTDNLETLSPVIWQEMTALAQRGVRLLKEGFGAQGVNLGMNLGEVGGAGIAEHIHLHLVPRWQRDTNFITAIGDTRVYSTDFEEIYRRLLAMAPKYMG